MKWIVGVLLLLNAGLFIWAYGKRPATTDYIRPTVNGETMMLIQEMQPAKSTVVITAATPKPAREEDLTIPREDLAEEVQAGVVEQVPPFCLRIGPFYDENLAEKTENQMKSMKLAVSSRTVKAREVRAYRVFLGPFDTREHVNAMSKELNEKGIRDHYIKRETGKKDVISLGLFTQKTGSESLVDQLQKKGVAAKIETEDRLLAPTFWLELTNSAANRKTQPELTAIKNWGDNRTKLTEFPCS
ncbi:SPOR domain-containing protein [Pseudomonadota bacterium]